MKQHSILYSLFLAAFFITCVEPFDPPEIVTPDEIVVIEGTLDAPDGRATIRLSQIRNISTTEADSALGLIRGATVTITLDGSVYTIPEVSPGIYQSLLPVSEDSQASLQVQALGEIFESTEVIVPTGPPIDSLTFSADERGVQVEVTTHDPENSTRYYQWTYVETVEFRTQFGSGFYYDGSEIIQRDEQTFRCWQTIPSTSISVATTDGLSEDVVFKYPLIFIPSDSWKRGIEYSVLVDQYAISEEAYIFLKELENNTENVGTLFDPQPGRIFGNIQNVSNPEKYVIGQFSARATTQKRFFVSADELPDYPRLPDVCSLIGVDSLLLPEIYERTTRFGLIAPIVNFSGSIIGYTTAAAVCMDCRLLREGSTNIQPDFWE